MATQTTTRTGPVSDTGVRDTAAPEAVAVTRDPVWRAWGRAVRETYTEIFIDDWGPRRWVRARIAGACFLLFLTSTVNTTVHSGWSAGKVGLTLAGLTTFVGCYLTVVWRNTPVLHGNRSPYAVGIALLIGTALLVPLGRHWLIGFAIYTVAMLLFNSGTRWWPPIVLGIPLLVSVAGIWPFGMTIPKAFADALPVLLIGASIAAFYQQIRAKMELRQARAELARLAVSEERLRIARDLHDILGQRLSALSIKAELAARLVRRDPDRAAAEMGEVAAVARDALSDVRETVSGYRTASFAGEVETARALLTAAGVRLDVTLATQLPAGLQECCGWVVREAVTNVIRHASANHCAILAAHEAGMVVVEIRDDGGTNSEVAAASRQLETPDGAAAGTVVYGNGLTGLSERVGAHHGALTARCHGGWFAVRATFPVPSVHGAVG